ncbi:MAG: hypothetical protein WBQ55_13360, partial [Xanthobacteraceae bacterium]
AAGGLLAGALLAGADGAAWADAGPHNDENKNPAAANTRDVIDSPEPRQLAPPLIPDRALGPCDVGMTLSIKQLTCYAFFYKAAY